MARPAIARQGSASYWDADGWDPDDRVYVGASLGQTNHHLAVQPEDSEKAPRAAERDGLGAVLSATDSPKREDSQDFWDSMQPPPPCWQPPHKAGTGTVTPSLCTTVDAPPGATDEPVPSSGVPSPGGGSNSSESFWDQAGWGDGVPAMNYASAGSRSAQPAQKSPAAETAPCEASREEQAPEPRLARVNSAQYWDAEQWDPDERVYVGAEIGRTDHLTAVDLKAQEQANELWRVWTGGLASSGLGLGEKAGPPIDLTSLTDGRPKLHDIYEISDETLGVGSFGVVRSGCHRASGTKCAIKAMGKMAAGERYRKNLLNGLLGERLLRLTREDPHKNVAAYFDFLEGPNHWYVVMEELSGPELMQQLEEQFPVTEAYLQRIMPQVLMSLAHIHGKAGGMVHRDVKLSNFRFRAPTPDAALVLLDFGFACSAHAEWDRAKCGTLMFMAPEVLSSTARTPHLAAMDVWAAGVILFVLLTGDSPIQDKEIKLFEKPETAGEAAQVLAKALDARDVKLASGEVVDLLHRLLVIDPAERLAAAEALKHEWFSIADNDRTLSVPGSKYRRAQSFSRRGSSGTIGSTRPLNRLPSGRKLSGSTGVALPDVDLGLDRIMSGDEAPEELAP